ncbi:hypothetical protein TRAPUB_7185, partial [Trametes pubescens]
GRFPKLNDKNYVEWAMRMEAELVRHKLWDGIVEITLDVQDPAAWQEEYEKRKKKRSVQKMSEARAEIIMQVEDGQLSHMRSRDPMEIWATLEEVHKARGFATQLAMKRSFLTAKKRMDQPMQAWIGEVRSMAFRMEEAGLVVSNQDKILAVTMGLPVAYDPVIISLDATPTEQLTLDFVISRLLNEEVRQSVGHYRSECPDRLAWETSKAVKASKAAGGANMAVGAFYERADYNYEDVEEVDGAW